MSVRSVALYGAVAVAAVSVWARLSTVTPPKPVPIYMHVKHDVNYPTIGKVRQIYNSIKNTGFIIGLQPQCVADWNTQKAYFAECSPDIAVMLTVFASDTVLNGAPYLDLSLIKEAVAVCPVHYLRFHEAISWCDSTNTPYPTDYIRSVLQYAKDTGIPVFWNEWNVYTYPAIANIISGYEDTVAVSFGTNNAEIEPAVGYTYLQRFRRRAASVQSWYWYERHGRQEGYEYTMPPELMALHTQQAFQAGCEVVQYEPYGYFFDNLVPRVTVKAVLGQVYP